VLMRGVQNGTLYKLLGSTISNGCNSFVVLRVEMKKTKPLCLWRKDNVVASKTGTYWREGPSSTTW
jgi:hypothetical protein